MTRIELPGEPQRILIIKPSALGDVVHTLPVLSLLRSRFPKAHIAWLIGQPFAGLIEGHPQLDEVIPFDRHGLASWWHNPSTAVRLGRFLIELKRHEFDLIIDLQGLLRSGLLSSMARAPVRIGFAEAREGSSMFYTHAVTLPTREMHAVDRNLAVCDALGCEGPVEFGFADSHDDCDYVKGFVEPIAPYAVLLPGTNWQTKKWPAEKFGALTEPLRRRFGLASVLAGATDAADVGHLIRCDVDLAGRTNLRQLVALLRGASLVIANDSGPMHIAAALGRPLVTMFGPTNPVRTGPWRRMECVVRVDLPCSPCYSRKCSHISCMKFLEVEQVLSVAQAELEKFSLFG